jgi:hypothetical protein
MEVLAPAYHTRVERFATEKTAYDSPHWQDEVEKLVDDVWAVLVQGCTGSSGKNLDYTGQDHHADKLGLYSPALPWYAQPPPSYDDAVNDLPPEYSALPPLAERKDALSPTAPPAPATKSRNRSRSLYKDTFLDVYIDFENPVGVREHKKKKGAGGGAAKKPAAPPPPPDNGGGSNDAGDDQANSDGNAGGDAGGGDGGGDDGGGGGGDGGGDDWNTWGTVAGTKKKTKKQEEEEEEERKAAEAAKNNLSWADDADAGGGDDWAGFTAAGKKKKGKVSTYTTPHFDSIDTDATVVG